ncbi:hypothetical protein N7G274_005909 [Stereocaulon virgatum]|uniref:Uncharacterized protein n=1 Tax=Stereocaulon virgatum TaxID=373712 RepID=A0ABR4A6J5_9LECA
MADAGIEWMADISKIQDIAQGLNETGKVPRSLKDDLESRLVLAWGAIPGPRDRSKTAWRRRNTQNMYQEIQDESHHLFLTFILAMGTTACSRSGFKNCVQALLKADKDKPYRLRLNPEAKELFEYIAIKQGFAGDPRCINFMRSVFSKGLQDLIMTNTLRRLTNEHSASFQEENIHPSDLHAPNLVRPTAGLIPSSLSDQNVPQVTRTTDHTPQMVLDLKLSDLLIFLQQYEASCPNLQMICPVLGVPLPSIIVRQDSS